MTGLDMTAIEPIPLPLPHIGSVNTWLLRGAPLTLVDTGPRSGEALATLEHALGRRGLRIEDIELVIGTHHHHDHMGLAATIKRRSGAAIAVIDRAADYGRAFSAHIADERWFARELMRGHGVPDDLHAVADDLWRYIDTTAESFETDIRLSDGDRILAGGRELRVIHRPGHSRSDTLFVDVRDRLAIVGDHVLAKITPNTEIGPAAGSGQPRTRSRVEYLDGLKLTARMPVTRMLTGHGPVVLSIREVVDRQLAQHRRRCRQIMRILDHGAATAFDIARRMWSERIVHEQPLFVLWEVLGHLDLLLSVGVALEQGGGEDPTVPWRYSLTRRDPRAPHRKRGIRVAALR